MLCIVKTKYLASGAAPELKKEWICCDYLVLDKDQATPIKSNDDIESIATISANGDKVIARLILKAVDLVGKDGQVTIEEARSVDKPRPCRRFCRSGYQPPLTNDEKRVVLR